MSDEPERVQPAGMEYETHVEGGGAVASFEEAVVAPPLALLDSSEIIELSIKPSLWFVPIVAARTVGLSAAVAGLSALASQAAGGWSTVNAYVAAAALLVAVGRVVLASLQWASRLYLLTNRRVVRFSGVFSVEVAECPLARIGQTHIHLSAYQRPLGVGTIRMTPIDPRLEALSWEHVSPPALIYERLVRAIRRAQSGE